MPVPRVGLAFGHQFAKRVANQAQCGEFPFGFCGQTVFRKEHPVFNARVTEFAVGAVARQTLAHPLPDVLAVQVTLRGEVFLVDLRRGVVGQQPFTNQNALVHAVGTPLAKGVGLQPTHAHHGVVAVRGVTQVVLHQRFVVSQLVAPCGRVRQGPLHNFGVRRAVNAFQPVDVFQPKVVRHLGFVQVKRRDAHPARDVVPRVIQVVVDLAHRERAAFNEHEARPRFLLEVRRTFESAVVGHVVGPTCGAGSLVVAARCGGEHNEQGQKA